MARGRGGVRRGSATRTFTIVTGLGRETGSGSMRTNCGRVMTTSVDDGGAACSCGPNAIALPIATDRTMVAAARSLSMIARKS
jgi:hypothetical protein